MTGARLAAGPMTARIVVVVDSARKWDVIKEGLLVGPAGSRFEEWLQGVGLRRSDLYVTTLVTDRVTKDNLRTKPKAEVEYAVELLHQRLAKLADPWVIVPMDEVALTALTGKRKLSKWRGSILQYVDARGRAIKVIPTIHPQETFRAATLERWCRYDWARIAGDSQFRELRLPERALHIRPTLRDVQQFVKDLPAFEAVSLDIETPRQVVLREKVLKSGKTKVSKAYGASRITCIAFAPAANWAICVPTTLDYWGNKADLAQVWSLVKAVCGHGVPKVLQNGLFDRFHLKRERDIDVVNHRWDTLCLSHAWDSASKHNLAKLASIWTREPYWKDDAKDLDDDDGECDFEDVKSIDDFWRYCAKDAAVTYEIKDRIVPVLEADGKLARYMQHYPPLFDPLLKMMLDGVRQDPHTKAAHIQQLDVDLAAHRTNLDIETTTNITYKDGTPYGKSIIAKKAISNKLLQEVLYDVLRLPKRERLRKDTGEKSTTADSAALRSLALRYKATCGRLVELILAYRRTGKIKDFIKEGVADADHRVRCQYKFTTECLLPEAEVLTPHGWRQIQTLQPDTQVAQWDSVTGDVTYAEANVSSWKFDGEMVQAGSSFHRQVYTPDHRIPTIPYGTKSVQVVSAESLYLTNKHTRIPVSGFYQGGTKLDVNFLRLCAAIQADGSYHGKGIVFNLRRPRKITRLRQLCDNVGITMTEWQTKFGWFRGYMPSTLAAAYQDFLGPEKTFSYKLLEFSYPALLGWLREIAYWDGCTSTGKQFRYYSTQRVNCEWVQTIAHLCGHSASITQRGGSTSFANAQPVWCCWVSHKITRQSQQEDYTKYPYQGKVWCVTVPSGFILTRYQNTIVVTGNTHRLASSKNPGRTGQNLQNVGRSVRRHYLSDPGTVFIELDASQAEDRIVKTLAYLLTGNKDLLWRAQAQPWENDEHKRAAQAIFNVNVADVTKQQRTLGKTSRHACHDDQTEVLTESGWVVFPEYVKRPVPIAEWNADDETIVFKRPQHIHQYDFDGDLYTFDAKGFSQHVTGNHRMRYHRPYACRDHIVVANAATLATKTKLRFQTTGSYTGTQKLDPAFVRLLVATQADGCIRDGVYISFRLKRQRKIERLRRLLTTLGIDGHERIQADGVTEFSVHKQDATAVIAWLGPEKTYGAWLLQLDATTLDCLLAELVHWDGHQAKTSLIYWSAKRTNVDWIQTIAHLRGVRSLIRMCHGCWRLYLSPVYLTSVKHVATKAYVGKVYCVTTSTGYFMVRKNTYISISCNSNYGMGGKTHSENLLKQGVVITPDEAQTMIDAIMAADPEIAEWQRATRIAVMRDRAITNVWGWTLSFQYDRLDDSVYRRAYAYRPQSDCGIMTNMNGIVPFWVWLADQRRRHRTVSWLLTRLALQVHDALIVCCPPETAYDVASFLKRHLETPLPYDGGRCPLVIPATLKIGTDWSMPKEYVRFPSREELEADCRALLATAVQREAVAVG